MALYKGCRHRVARRVARRVDDQFEKKKVLSDVIIRPLKWPKPERSQAPNPGYKIDGAMLAANNPWAGPAQGFYDANMAPSNH